MPNFDRVISLLILSLNYACSQYSCADESVRDSTNNNFHWRGTALGGWLVLEPWITPSLFYQFLGASEKWGENAKDKVAIDSHSFCIALGKEEANKQLRRHWATWVTEDNIRELSQMGVDTLRIPVADWMYIPYEPYIGCWDGAMEELHRALSLCQKYNIKVMLDLHAMKDSQNGLDNSGKTADIVWTHKNGVTKYRHWDIRAGNWVGKFNTTSGQYDVINMENIQYSLAVIAKIVEVHRNSPVIVALEPINEPIQYTPLHILKYYYWESYQLVQANAPHWVTVFHDSFRLTPDNWGNFMRGCPNYAFDAHIYQAWADPAPITWFQEISCADGNPLRIMEDLGIPVIVGEWSLAIDNCAMWLNGLNDNVYGYPKVQCEMVTCPEPYMGVGVQPGAPPDPSKGPQDPFGSGESYVSYGKCPRDHYIQDEDKAMRALTMAKLYAFDLHTHGEFFWNFRTEFEPRWDFLEAVRRGWIPSKWTDKHAIKLLKEMHASCLIVPPLNETVTEPIDLDAVVVDVSVHGNPKTLLTLAYSSKVMNQMVLGSIIIGMTVILLLILTLGIRRWWSSGGVHSKGYRSIVDSNKPLHHFHIIHNDMDKHMQRSATAVMKTYVSADETLHIQPLRV